MLNALNASDAKKISLNLASRKLFDIARHTIARCIPFARIKKRGANKMVYYNENDPFCVKWLRELINAELIADGHIDERDIQNVKPTELRGYKQHHFFAGIGGWSLALQMAGWPDDKPIWSGSCPCQPFSGAGKRKGFSDERHLWPHFKWLIEQYGPATVVGEQVAQKLGREWFHGIRNDLETLGYEVGAADLCASSVGAPHIRQRLFWVADINRNRFDKTRRGQSETRSDGLVGNGSIGRMGNATFQGLQDRTTNLGVQTKAGQTQTGKTVEPPMYIGDTWRGKWIACADGKSRRIKPGICAMVNGFPNRVGILRGFGNSIVPQLASVFIKSYMQARRIQ